MGRGRLPSTNNGSFRLARERIRDRFRARLLAVGARRKVDIKLQTSVNPIDPATLAAN